MFSPRVYARLFEQLHEAWWPLHALVLAAGVAGLVALARGRGTGVLAAGLGAAWVFCATVFVHGLYAPVNWAAAVFVPPLVALGLLLPLRAWAVREGVPVAAGTRRVALGLALWAVLGHPLLALASEGGWRQAEWLGLAPDPTAVATLALLVVLPRRAGRRQALLAALTWLPVLGWCMFNAVLLAAMGHAQALVLPLAAALALGARGWDRASGRRGRRA